MSNPWFRLYHEIIDDEKLLMLSFQDRWHYVVLLALKCRGVLDKEPNPAKLDRKVAAKIGVATSEAIELKRRLSEEYLIDDSWQPLGWDNRQFESDSSTKRVQAYRERQKSAKNKQSELSTSNEDETFHVTEDETFQERSETAPRLTFAPEPEKMNTSDQIGDENTQKSETLHVTDRNVSVTAQDTDTDTDTDKELKEPPPDGGPPVDKNKKIPDGAKINQQGEGGDKHQPTSLPDPPRTIFELGVPMLKGQGITESSARSYLALLIRSYGEERTANAIAQASIKKPVELKAWLIGYLKDSKPSDVNQGVAGNDEINKRIMERGKLARQRRIAEQTG